MNNVHLSTIKQDVVRICQKKYHYQTVSCRNNIILSISWTCGSIDTIVLVIVKRVPFCGMTFAYVTADKNHNHCSCQQSTYTNNNEAVLTITM